MEAFPGGQSSHEKWATVEAIPIIETLFVQGFRNFALDPWRRKDGKGVFLRLEGANQLHNCHISKIQPGQNPKPQGPLFEETIYIIKY